MGCRSACLVVMVASSIASAGCGAEVSLPDANQATQPATSESAAPDRLGRVDPDPYDGRVGEIQLTDAEVGYRDKFGLTDLEAHDAFGYSCGISQNAKPIERFANQPRGPVEP